MSEEGKEAVAVSQAETTYITSIHVPVPQNVVQMQAATQSQQTIVPQSSPQVQAQGMAQSTGMAQVMAQGPQTAQSPHGVAASMPQQSPQYYVQASIASAMQGPPAIAPAPGPQTSTTTVSALHQPLQHHLAHQSLTHPGVSQSPMPQYPQQVQVIQSGIPGGPYLQQLYQNAQGHLLMPIQPHGMNTQIQQGTLNPLNSSIQVITAGKPFQGQLGPHMLTSAGGKPGVLQSGQASYNHAGNPNSGGQTVLIGQLGGQLGVISSQNPNIMNAQQTGQKPGDMHKVNNMQTFQQGIAWATPGSIHSPTILQNQPIFIRGPQPGQENNLYIQSAPQQQAMIPQNCTTAMVSSIAAMPAQNQQNKPRTGMEMQANIQPKVSMRPHNILPSMTTTQIRPGSSVSTQTASGQSTAQSQMGNQRSQGKVRGKNAAHRTSPAINAQHQISVGQVLQNQQTTTISISGAPNSNQLTILPTSHAVTATVAAPIHKQLSQVPQMENFNNMAQPKPGTPVHPPTAPIQPSTPGSRMAKGSPSTSPLVSSSQVNVSAAMLTTMATPMPISTQTTMSPVPIIPSSHLSDVATVTSSNATQMLPTSTYANAMQSVTASYSSHDSNFSHPGKLTTTVASLPVTTTTTSRLADIPTIKTESGMNSTSLQQDTNGQGASMNHVYSLPLASSSVSGSGTTSNSTTNTEVADNVTNGVSPLKNGKLPSTEKTVSNSSGPPKAMVKPQVMTHVIEGFVIHEASEPFPVNRSSLLTDLNKVRSSNASNTATVLPQGNLAHEKEEDSEYAKCEVCGKTDLRSKFKKKRFCSVTCASKRGVNKTGVPKRGIEPYKGPEDPSPKRFKEANKAEHDEYDSNNGTLGESSHNVNDEQDSFKTQKVDILKWTVRDVVEFIRNLPGCQDYAEDFAIQEIDGQALMLLKADHLMTAMSMKLGPALKICNKIETMKGDKKET